MMHDLFTLVGVVLGGGALAVGVFALGYFAAPRPPTPDPALERERREVRESARREVVRVRERIKSGVPGVTVRELDAAYARLIEVSGG